MPCATFLKHGMPPVPRILNELKTYGRIYMYRFRPDYDMYTRPIEHTRPSAKRQLPLCYDTKQPGLR